MSSLSQITRINLPIEMVNQVYEHLRKAGQQGVEGVALWAGEFDDMSFNVRVTIIPKQIAYSLQEGLLYSVDGDELHRINVWLYKKKLRLIAQIHSHPGAAYHSETDDQFPIVAANGGVSIVVPDFAFRPFKLQDWAVYRLFPAKGWLELTESEVKNLINIVY